MRKMTASGAPPGYQQPHARNYTRHHEVDLEKIYHAMEKGHKVCKLNLLKRWDPAYKKLSLNRETRQLSLTKIEQGALRSKPTMLDLRYVKEVQILDFKLTQMKIGDKWLRDKELRNFDPQKILVISHGNGFVLGYWILLYDSVDACRLWSQGVHALMMDTVSSSHAVIVERWLRKQFYNLIQAGHDKVAMKHMKPFVQTSLQFKVSSKYLTEITEEEMTFEVFSKAARQLIYLHQLFSSHFTVLSDDGSHVSFNNFLRFLKDMQNDEQLSSHRERASEFLRRYIREVDPSRDVPTPTLTVMEFNEFLFSRENSIWDSMNEKVVHDMTRPLSHYWVASSHNTYLTGDQLRSESSLDSYSRALLMGCRCIELDCWDGQKKSNSTEFLDIVIYHGYTMTSKLLLRDVLQTIKHYAFINSEYPVILSIEDNCSVPAQRLLAQEVKEILGDLLLSQPVSRDETQLPSPAALKKKIILKHKKLAVESEELAIAVHDELQDTDILSRECVRRGILWLRNSVINEWTSHVFVLFADRLCYMLEACAGDTCPVDSISMKSEDEIEDEGPSGLDVRPEEMHVTEEWFHGRIDRQAAVTRLLEHKEKGNGVFLVRDSTTFIGDYSLSFVHAGQVHHCRIKTTMQDGEKKYYFLANKQMDTLYTLISYYTKVMLATPKFHAYLATPCPQPQPHLEMPWFSDSADKQRAEELLNMVKEDGAFLIRYSSSDRNVFVLSLRVDGEFWHYRLKRDGRIFVVNQTVFENLNQIVEYYGTRDFVRGISLKYPVNEHDVGLYASAERAAAAAPGCYMELKDLEKEVQARALRPYRATSDDELTFPVNALITVLRKEEQLWRGRYGSQIGWFPPAYVSEIVPEKAAREANQEAQFGVIELAGVLVERMQQGETDRPHAVKITQTGQHWKENAWLLAAGSPEEADDWCNQLLDLTRSVNDKISYLRNRENSARIAAELSNLVVYCQAVPFDPDHITDGSFYEMCSFSENRLDKLLDKGLVQFNQRQLSRVYPQGSRVTSSNYAPVAMWNAGCHMVALNYQTGDKPMQLNQGKFMANGQCGFVLKPGYMLDEGFDPMQGEKVMTSCPVTLTVQVIGGRHLSRRDKAKGICSPFVELELIGLPCDEKIYKTRTIASNGLNPLWNQTFVFHVRCPELAMIRFLVEDGDFVGPKTDPFIGQAVFPLDSIRTGYRSVPLRNQHCEELELSSLLVLVHMHKLGECGQTIRSAHSVLQANRSVFAAGRAHSLTSSRMPSFDLGSSPSLPSPIDRLSTDVERKLTLQTQGSSSTETTPTGIVAKRSLGSISTEGRSMSVDSNDVPLKKSSMIGRLFKFQKKDKEKSTEK